MSFPYPATDTLTILAAGTNSSALTPEERSAMVKLMLPAAMTGTALKLQGSLDGVAFGDVYLDGSAVSFTFGANQVHDINPRATFGLRSVRVVSNATETGGLSVGAVMTKVV